MKDTIIKLFNLEPSELKDIEIVSTEYSVHAIKYRQKADLSGYFSRISPDERDKVKYICMDMFQLYKDVAEVYFPCAKICIDSFHVIQQVNNASRTDR